MTATRRHAAPRRRWRWWARRRHAPPPPPAFPERRVPDWPPLPPTPPVAAEATEPERIVDVGTQTDLEATLRGLHAAVDSVTGAVVASRDGLPMASTLPDAQTARLAAMAAAVLALADQAVGSTDRDAPAHTVIRATAGCLAVYEAGPDAVLAVRTVARPNLGLVQVEVPAVVGAVARTLG